MTVSEAGRKGGKARLRKMTAEDRKRVAMLGGEATARKLTSAERSESARRAAKARWKREKKRKPNG